MRRLAAGGRLLLGALTLAMPARKVAMAADSGVLAETTRVLEAVPATEADNDCVDQDHRWAAHGSSCDQMRRLCDDPGYGRLVRAWCPRTCGLCMTAPAQTGPSFPTAPGRGIVETANRTSNATSDATSRHEWFQPTEWSQTAGPPSVAKPTPALPWPMPNASSDNASNTSCEAAVEEFVPLDVVSEGSQEFVSVGIAWERNSSSILKEASMASAPAMETANLSATFPGQLNAATDLTDVPDANYSAGFHWFVDQASVVSAQAIETMNMSATFFETLDATTIDLTNVTDANYSAGFQHQGIGEAEPISTPTNAVDNSSDTASRLLLHGVLGSLAWSDVVGQESLRDELAVSLEATLRNKQTKVIDTEDAYFKSNETRSGSSSWLNPNLAEKNVETPAGVALEEERRACPVGYERVAGDVYGGDQWRGYEAPKAESMQDCAARCSRTPGCGSFEYNREDKRCFRNSQTRPTDEEERPGFVFCRRRPCPSLKTKEDCMGPVVDPGWYSSELRLRPGSYCIWSNGACQAPLACTAEDCFLPDGGLPGMNLPPRYTLWISAAAFRSTLAPGIASISMR